MRPDSSQFRDNLRIRASRAGKNGGFYYIFEKKQ